MIKELFLPRFVKNYYLFPTRTVGFEITKTYIAATQIYSSGKSTKIEKYIEVPIEHGNSTNAHERIVKALQIVLPQLDRYDYIHTALPSSVVIFKELRLPFLTYETIKKVVNYEVEPLLPFALHDAVIDFVITKEHTDQSSSEVMVAAVQNQYIEQHLQLFIDAGVDPHVITIDFFALYELLKKNPSFMSEQDGILLVELCMHTTRIAYLQDGQLKFIRTLAKGIHWQAKEVGLKLNMQQNEVMEQLLRFGLEKNNNSRITQTMELVFVAFWREIQFTLQSLTSTTRPIKIFLFGSGAELKGMVDFASTQLQSPCHILQPANLLNSQSVSIKVKSALPSTSIISLATALTPPGDEQVNLRQGIFQLQGDSLLGRQLLLTCGLFLVLVISLITFSFIQIRSLANEAIKSEQEALEALKERAHFEKVLQEGLKGVKDKDKLEEAKHLAENEVNDQKNMWFAFAGSARASVLKYLLELTSRIDKDALGFNLESLVIEKGIMTLKAQVKDHEALKLLEKSLDESPLFRPVEKVEKTDFIMHINLAKNNEEQ